MLTCPGHCGGTGMLNCGTPCPVCNPKGRSECNGGPVSALTAVAIIGEAFPGLFVGLNDGFDENLFMEDPEDD